MYGLYVFSSHYENDAKEKISKAFTEKVSQKAVSEKQINKDQHRT